MWPLEVVINDIPQQVLLDGGLAVTRSSTNTNVTNLYLDKLCTHTFTSGIDVVALALTVRYGYE